MFNPKEVFKFTIWHFLSQLSCLNRPQFNLADMMGCWTTAHQQLCIHICEQFQRPDSQILSNACSHHFFNMTASEIQLIYGKAVS